MNAFLASFHAILIVIVIPIGFIPLLFIGTYISNIILPMIVFMVLNIFLIYKNKSFLIKYNVLIHLLAILTTKINLGQTIAGSDKFYGTIYTLAWASFFAILTTLFIIIFIIKIIITSTNKKGKNININYNKRNNVE